jgi:hypothetical protein
MLRRTARASLFSDCAWLGGNSFYASSTLSNSIHMIYESRPSSGECFWDCDILSPSYVLIYLIREISHESLHAAARGHDVASITARAGPVEARGTPCCLAD